MGSTSVPLPAQHDAVALIQLAIIWVWEGEYGIFQTSEIVKAGKKCSWKQHVMVAKKPGAKSAVFIFNNLQVMLSLKNKTPNPDLSPERAVQKGLVLPWQNP